LPEEHAVGFVNEMLKRRGGAKRVSKAELRTGIVLATDKAQRAGPANSPRKTTPPRADEPAAAQSIDVTPRFDSGPAERAGVASPVDADRPGMLAGLLVAGLLAALGLTLRLADSRKKS
jgi:hypothetical protein